MKSKIHLLMQPEKFWGILSGLTAYSFQIPISIATNLNEKNSSMMVGEHNNNLTWLSDYSPEFRVSSKNIKILKEPSEFFKRLKDLSKNSSKRITLASLYIGNGSLEKELVSSINEGLENSSGKLKVKILLDYTRGSRGKENSRTLLLPLLKNFPSQLEVSLYHTPKLRGFIKWLLPDRWNETVGLSHLKVYLFDDTLILSGANLSDQYFSNRQDRYIVFEDCKDLCNYFDDLVTTISSMSFLLTTNDSVVLHPDWNVHPSEGSYEEFVSKANKRLQKFIYPAQNHKQSLSKNSKGTGDTVVYPLLQMFTFGIRQDEQVVERFLCLAEPGSHIKLASGYFNLTNHYMNIILKSSKAIYSLLVASPKVNGFYGAAGFSGAIPMIYTHIVKVFFSKVLNYKQHNRIELREYERSDWTFHVKGLWYYKPQENLPSVTFVGSPNFGCRSVYKDLEAQVAIITENENLKLQLHNEQQRLYDRTTVIDKSLFQRPDHQVSLWIKLVTFFIRDFF